MARLVIEHEDFTLRFRCSKLGQVLEKAANNGLTAEGGQLYSDYSWSGHVLSVKIEKDEASENIPVSAICTGGETSSLRQAPYFFDNAAYRVSLKLRETPGVVRSEPRLGKCPSIVREQFDHEGGHLYGTLQFQNDIGKSDFNVVYLKDGVKHSFRFTFHVLSSKLDYHHDWKQIVDDVEEEYRMLSYDFLKRTYHSFKKDEDGTSSDMIWWKVFERHRIGFMDACRLILDRPRLRYRKVDEFRRADQLRLLTPALENEFAENRANASHLYLNAQGHQTKDTPENRFFKFAVATIAAKHDRLAARVHFEAERSVGSEAGSEGKKRKDFKELSKEVSETSTELKRLKNQPFFRGIGPFTGFKQVSLVLQQAPGYAQMMRIYAILNALYDLQDGLYGLETKNIADLYELWCFIEVKNQVARALDVDTKTIKHTNRTETGDWFGEDPKKGKQSKVIIENAAKTIRLEVFYNPTATANGNSGIEGTRAPTGGVQKPDIVLRLTKEPDKHFKLTYLFDAKYRLNNEDATSGLGAPPDDAINQLHRYRDAIYYEGAVPSEVSSESDGDLKKEVIGGYILFPGKGDKAAIENSPLFRSIAKVNIGALPLRPGDEVSRDFLRDFIKILVEKNKDEHLLGTGSLTLKGTESVLDGMGDPANTVQIVRYKGGITKELIVQTKICPCEKAICDHPERVKMLVFPHVGGGAAFKVKGPYKGPMNLAEFVNEHPRFDGLQLASDPVYFWNVEEAHN